jgi:hypothetical protein
VPKANRARYLPGSTSLHSRATRRASARAPRRPRRRRAARRMGGRSIPATRPSEAGLRPRRGRGGDGLLAREGDNPLGDLGPPIVELAVE